MVRAVYGFQSLTLENRDWKEAEAMSKEIIQFDDAMFETKLDAMVRDKVEQIVNAMPDASGRRDRQRREIRTNRRTQGVPCRPLRTQSDGLQVSLGLAGDLTRIAGVGLIGERRHGFLLFAYLRGRRCKAMRGGRSERARNGEGK